MEKFRLIQGSYYCNGSGVSILGKKHRAYVAENLLTVNDKLKNCHSIIPEALINPL